MMVSPGQALRSAATIVTSANSCSQLSNTSNISRPCNAAINVPWTSACAISVPPSACSRVDPIRAGSWISASDTQHTPSGKEVASYASATRSARRVFPTPPGPVRVSKRTSGLPHEMDAISASSRSRPNS